MNRVLSTEGVFSKIGYTKDTTEEDGLFVNPFDIVFWIKFLGNPVLWPVTVSS